MAQIAAFGPKIAIKPAKTSVVAYTVANAGKLAFELIDGMQGRNGLEYLGFRFDGRRVYLRDSTLSGFYRKMGWKARRCKNAR
jgi:hypothetical protein